MSKLRQRSIFGGLFIVFGALLFLVASAFIVDRGYPKILAAVVGGLAFPVLPVAWHVWGEQKRKKKLAEEKDVKKKPSTLTAFDRYWLRYVGVAILIVGPMVAIAKIEVARAAVRHYDWFIPAFEPGLGMVGEGAKRDLGPVEPLLKRVPSDADVVVVVTPSTINGEAVIAFSNHDLVAAADGNIPRDDDTIRKLDDVIKKQRSLLLDPIAMVIDRDLTVASSDKWKTKVDPAPGGVSSTLRRDLERAPADAILFTAFTPRTIKNKAIRSGALWAAVRNKHLILEARVEAYDVRAAYELLTQVKALKADALPIPNDCKAPIDVVLQNLELAQIGTTVVARASVSESIVDDLTRCVN